MYKSGDVILAQVPFSDGYGYKTRPAIIAEHNGNYYLVCCCTSKDKSEYLAGTWIEKKSKENQLTKFKKSTFISYDNIVSLHHEAILYKSGSCPAHILKEIKKHISENNL